MLISVPWHFYNQVYLLSTAWYIMLTSRHERTATHLHFYTSPFPIPAVRTNHLRSLNTFVTTKQAPIMKFSAVLPFFLSTLAMAAPIDDAEQTESTSDDKPPPSQVSIRGVKWNGSGCPSNGVQSIINADATIVTLLFSNYTASVGQGISRAEGRKNCQVSLDLQYPSGYAYSVADVTIRGYIDIDAGVTATVQSRYYFQGMTGGHDVSTHIFTHLIGNISNNSSGHQQIRHQWSFPQLFLQVRRHPRRIARLVAMWCPCSSTNQ